MHNTKFSFDYGSALKQKLTKLKIKIKTETAAGAVFLQHTISMQLNSNIIIY